MIIPINENWQIVTSALSLDLQQRIVTPETRKDGRPNKNPGETWLTRTYHASIRAALESYTRRELLELKGLERLAEAEKRLKAEIAKVRDFKPSDYARSAQ